MFGLTITVKDDGVAEHIERETDKMIGDFLQVVISVYQKMFEGSRSGRLYRQGSFKKGQSKGLGIGRKRARGSGSRIHRASRPGEALARDTGKTARLSSVRRLKSGVYRIRFGGGVRYWEIRDDGRERPTILPAIQKAAEIYFG
jgi:hypothetical protein